MWKLNFAESIQQRLQRPWMPFLIFLVMIVVLGLSFGYADLLQRPPMGLHQWRQTDCTSLAANYHHHGMHFFQPQIHHVLGGEGKAVAEFPIIYYFVAVLYGLFGQHDIIFRLVNLLILGIGLWYLFKMARLILEDVVLSLLITGYIFSSTVFAIYSISFVPDGPAFAGVMMGWYFFLEYAETGKIRQFQGSMAAFTFAGLLKATTFMSAVVVAALFLGEVLLRMRIKQTGKVFQGNKWLILLSGALPFVVMAGWYYWAIQYNKANSSIYFSTKMWPIWEMEKAEIWETANLMLKYWGNDYFWRKSWPLVIALCVVPLIWIRSVPRLAGLSTLGIAVGSTVFLFAWFFAFKNHDYYFIQFLPFFTLAILLGLATLRNRFPALRLTLWPAIILLSVVALSARNTHKQFDKRFLVGGAHYDTVNEDLFGFAETLDSLGISRDTKILSLPDFTPNASLYFMDRPGWTELYHPDFQAEYSQRFINEGADYMVINREEWLSHPSVVPFSGKPIYKYHEITVFDVREYRK